MTIIFYGFVSISFVYGTYIYYRNKKMLKYIDITIREIQTTMQHMSLLFDDTEVITSDFKYFILNTYPVNSIERRAYCGIRLLHSLLLEIIQNYENYDSKKPYEFMEEHQYLVLSANGVMRDVMHTLYEIYDRDQFGDIISKWTSTNDDIFIKLVKLFDKKEETIAGFIRVDSSVVDE